jgi:hypothetical protein
VSGGCHSVNDGKTSQTDNTNNDPFLGHVGEVGPPRQTSDQDNVSDDPKPK